MKIILASASPRRRELLKKLYSNFDIIVSSVDETLPSDVPCEKGVEILAVRKGAPISENNPDALVISSDTLVELDGLPLGKPKDKEEAFSMLSSLSGRSHNVHTGVAVSIGGRVFSGTSSSKVTFRDIPSDEIRDYIETGEPLDKAGSYAIQGIGSKFVSSYSGSFDSIVGLDTELLSELIKKAEDSLGGGSL